MKELSEPDTFRRGDNVPVLCECRNHDGTPHKVETQSNIQSWKIALRKKEQERLGTENVAVALGLITVPSGTSPSGAANAIQIVSRDEPNLLASHRRLVHTPAIEIETRNISNRDPTKATRKGSEEDR